MMENTDMRIIDLIQRCSEQEDPLWKEIRQELIGLLKARRKARMYPEREVRSLFLELGAPDHLAGHPYAVKAILMALQDREQLQSLTRVLYPNLADHFGTSPARIERGIRHLVEVTWMRGDEETQTRYFGNIINADRGKPTNGEFISCISEKLRG